MTRTTRASGAPLYAAVGIAILALLVAATTTAFAAGLAANSVGTKQLKKNAVSAKKIKNNAVTGAKIKNGAVTGPKITAGAVTADKIAKGVLPAKSLYVSRELTVSPFETALGSVGGLTFVASCNSALRDFAQLFVDKVGGGDVNYHGISSQAVTGSVTTFPMEDVGAINLEIFDIPPVDDGFANTSWDGVVTSAGGAPVRIQATVRVDDGDAVPCKIRVAATPLT